MQTVCVAPENSAPEMTIDNVQRELEIGWEESDALQLRRELQPYIDWVQTFLNSGEDFPSHIENSGSLAVPVGESTTPADLFATLGPGVSFNLREYADFWITVHYPNPEPVVTLLPKSLPGMPTKLLELCERCGKALGVPVGGTDGVFLAWLLPGFSWAMHTDHDNLYEQIAARIHVPIITNTESLYIWGRRDSDGQEEWLLRKHLESGKIYYVRVDVPHTVINQHATEPRLHLILDVREGQQYAGRMPYKEF
jgi:hypothetical protein